jgi:hypothetical protein
MSSTPYYTLGIDIGQSTDYTAVVLLEHERTDQPTYRLRALHRFPLGTPYTAIPPAISRRVTAPPLAGRTRIGVDATGVGRAITDHFREQLPRVPLYAITITSGTTTGGSDQHPNVPKRDLILTTALILEQHRLKIATTLPDSDTLLEELHAYRRTTSESGHDSYGAAAGNHDDLVLALSLAFWTGEHKPPPYPYARISVPKGRIPTFSEIALSHAAYRAGYPF